jgi:protoporphyrinogen oxidase
VNAPSAIAANDPFIIVGGGFTGLSAAYELASRGEKVVVLEKEPMVGGLASGFQVGEFTLERFYHHWFTNDRHVMNLIEAIDCKDQVVFRPTRTGMYYANTIFRLSTPLDLLKFSALKFSDRIRLGLLALRVRTIRDWKKIEHLTAREWLIDLAGPEVFRVVWEPLLVGKFGSYADKVGAVWFWKKLVLRGGSRTSDGREVLAYYRGGFSELAEALKRKLESMGVEIRLNAGVTAIESDAARAQAVRVDGERLAARAIMMTQALPQIADLLEGHVDAGFIAGLRRIDYLANVCLVLELDRSLSETYWLNVNDPSFPFVGVIEHTNFEPPENYGGRHIVFLSKYLPESDPLYRMPNEEVLDFAVPHLQRMFPNFRREWVTGHHVWRARFSQQIAEPDYSKLIPPEQSPIDNVLITSMAQIYPEDRGTNYAIREGRRAAGELAARFGSGGLPLTSPESRQDGPDRPCDDQHVHPE